MYVRYRLSMAAVKAYEAMCRKTFCDRTLLITFFPEDDFHEGNYY